MSAVTNPKFSLYNRWNNCTCILLTNQTIFAYSSLSNKIMYSHLLRNDISILSDLSFTYLICSGSIISTNCINIAYKQTDFFTLGPLYRPSPQILHKKDGQCPQLYHHDLDRIEHHKISSSDLLDYFRHQEAP